MGLTKEQLASLKPGDKLKLICPKRIRENPGVLYCTIVELPTRLNNPEATLVVTVHFADAKLTQKRVWFPRRFALLNNYKTPKLIRSGGNV